MRRILSSGLFLLGAAALAAAQEQQPDLGPGFQVFPPDNPWNWDVSGYQVHPNSNTYISTIGGSLPIERGSFRLTVVGAGQPLVTIPFTAYPGESDPGPGFGSPAGGAANGQYPIPPSARVELPPGGDTHIILIDRDAKLLYETWMTVGGPPWSAANGAIFDLTSNALRPDGWTSGDAAGLAIFPGLLRYEDVASGQLTHAVRFTTPRTQNSHIYPARHDAGQANAAYPPEGLRLRLKATYDITAYSGAARIVLEGLKKYGVMLADNGQNFISTTYDSRWDSTNVDQVGNVPITAYEAVLTVDSNGNPILPVGGGATPPTVATPAGADSGTTGGTTSTLSVLGADSAGEAGLTYTWSSTGPAPVTFSPNGTNAAKNTTATYHAAGTYTLTVTIRNSSGGTATSSTSVTVTQTQTGILVSPASVSIVVGQTQPFSATLQDQFGNAMASQPGFTWTAGGGGTISASGLYQAGQMAGGPFLVTASGGGLSGTASVTVTSSAPVLASVQVTPGTASVAPNGTVSFTATAFDQFGNLVQPQPAFGWATSGGGTIDSSGLFAAGGSPGGPFTVTATTGGVIGTASVTVAVSAPSSSGGGSGKQSRPCGIGTVCGEAEIPWRILLLAAGLLFFSCGRSASRG